MRKLNIKSFVAVFQVKDIHESIEWYKKWLGEADIIPMEGTAEYELTSGTRLQLSESENVVSSSVILGIEDIKKCTQDLDSLGIKTGDIADYEVAYVFDVFDIDNNQISFVQEL